VAAEDDAERVTDGVGEDPEAGLALTGDAGGAQREQLLLGLVGIAHSNVQVQLLRVRRVRQETTWIVVYTPLYILIHYLCGGPNQADLGRPGPEIS
jgi:hypothetical protein